MIFESYPWKSELRRHLGHFETWGDRSHTERGGFYIERGVFLSAFIVRKLMENRKVTDAIRSRSVRCVAYPAFRPLSDRVSRFFGVFDPNREYDISKGRKVQISTYDLMSEIMHSYVFIPIVDDNGRWTAFLVNSYNKRDDRLLEISRADFERVLKEVVDDNVVEVSVHKHPVSGKIHATVSGQAQKRRARDG